MENVEQTPWISFIVPVYNTAEYLAECLDSILTQSVKELEVVCVNDGSTDDSLSILESYRASDPRVVIVDQPNSGVAVARNNAIQKARGKYLCFVDSDDYIYPNYCARFLETAEKYQSETTRFCNRKRIRDVLRSYPHAKRIFDGTLFDNLNFDDLTVKDRQLLVYFASGCLDTMYRRDFWQRVNASFPQGVRIGEDVFVNFRFYAQACRAATFEDRLYYYREREGSATHPVRYGLGSYADLFDVYRRTRDFYRSTPEYEPLLLPLAAIMLKHHWRGRIEELRFQDAKRELDKVPDVFDEYVRRVVFRSGYLKLHVRLFWLQFWGRTAFERVSARISIGLLHKARHMERALRRRLKKKRR